MRPAKALGRLISHFGFEGRPLTTRWRWANSLTTPILKLITCMPQVKRVKSPIFILGTGRSGTTILGKVLSMHRDIAWLNEPKLLWHVVYPHEDLIGSYNHGSAYYRLTQEQVTQEVQKRIHRLYGLYLSLTRSDRVLDKYPEMIFRIPFLCKIFPDLKMLFIFRNGWDNLQSIALWSKRNQREKDNKLQNWWGVDNRKWHLLVKQVILPNPLFSNVIDELGNFSRPVDMAAVEWIATMREGLYWKDRIPHQMKFVRYEEMTRHPYQTMNQIAEFCDLSSDEAFLRYAQKILHPVPSKGCVELHPAIRPLFKETMEMLEYKV